MQKDAMKLKKRDRVRIDGVVQTITRRTTRDRRYPSVITIHTNKHDIMTTDPVTVTMAD